MKYLKSIMLILACSALLPAQASCAATRASMLVSATSVVSDTYVKIEFSDAHEIQGEHTIHFPATGAGGGDEGRGEVFRQKLLERMWQLSILEGVPCIISLEGNTNKPLHLLVQGGDALLFDHLASGLEIKGKKYTVIISLGY